MRYAVMVNIKIVSVFICLLNHSAPFQKSTGDFVAVAYSIIETRSTVQQPTQTVHDVNVLLDKLSKSEG